jgi:hypothetical protein
MAGKSNYLEDAVINSVLRGVAFPAVTGSTYVGLFTAAPTDAGGGTEVSGGSYARVAVSRATGSWDAPADQSGAEKTANTAAVTFPSPTANWGTVTHFGVFDASTAGNLLYWGALGTSRNILSGDVAPQFAAGALVITED